HNLTWMETVWRGGDIDNGPVGKFGCLPGVAAVAFLAESVATVENNVLRRVERIGVDQDWRMIVGIIRLVIRTKFAISQADGQFTYDFLEHTVTGRQAPKNEIVVIDVRLGHFLVRLYSWNAAELLPPLINRPV